MHLVTVAVAGGHCGAAPMQAFGKEQAVLASLPSSSSGLLLHAARDRSGLRAAAKAWLGAAAASLLVARVCTQMKLLLLLLLLELQQREVGLAPAGCATVVLSAALYYE